MFGQKVFTRDTTLRQKYGKFRKVSSGQSEVEVLGWEGEMHLLTEELKHGLFQKHFLGCRWDSWRVFLFVCFTNVAPHLRRQIALPNTSDSWPYVVFKITVLIICILIVNVVVGDKQDVHLAQKNKRVTFFYSMIYSHSLLKYSYQTAVWSIFFQVHKNKNTSRRH